MSIEPTKTTSSAQSGSTMRAVIQHEYGSADVLHIEHVDRPQMADDEVLLHVRAAGLDRGTWHLMTGKPYLLRLVFGLRRPENRVPGLDVAGTVIAAGPAVTRFAVGDEVYGFSGGSFAEYALAREAKLAPKPADLSFEQARGCPSIGRNGTPSARRRRPSPGRPEGADHRGIRRRRQLRRATGQGVRS